MVGVLFHSMATAADPGSTNSGVISLPCRTWSGSALAIASPGRHYPDLQAFLASCEVADTSNMPLPRNWPGWIKVSDHLKQFAGIDLPAQHDVRELLAFRDDWDDVELAVSFDSFFVHYHWYTTA